MIQIRMYVVEALEIWEPRIKIDRVETEPDPVRGRVDIIINYRLKEYPDLYSFVYPFYLVSSDFLSDYRFTGNLYHSSEYVGISVQTEIVLEPAYQNPFAEAEIINQLKFDLYQCLNPLTGGIDGTGWPFGRQVYTSDIVALM